MPVRLPRVAFSASARASHRIEYPRKRKRAVTCGIAEEGILVERRPNASPEAVLQVAVAPILLDDGRFSRVAPINLMLPRG